MLVFICVWGREGSIGDGITWIADKCSGLYNVDPWVVWCTTFEWPGSSKGTYRWLLYSEPGKSHIRVWDCLYLVNYLYLYLSVWPSGPMMRCILNVWDPVYDAVWVGNRVRLENGAVPLSWFYIPRPFRAWIAHGCQDYTRIAIGLWIAACVRLVFVVVALWCRNL